MSTTQEVREFFRTHLGVKMDNSQLREQLGTDDGNGISQALNLLHGNGEISRERRPSGTGWQYWAGAASRSEPIEPRLIKGSATSDNNELPPEKPRAAKKAKAAKPAKTKRKYTRKAKPAKAPKVRRRQARSAPPPGANAANACRAHESVGGRLCDSPGRRDRHRPRRQSRQPAARGSAAPAGLP